MAVAGGMSPGTEVWNPSDGSVVTVSEDFPIRSTIHRGAKMVSVKQGAELIFYESVTDQQHPKGIWKFDSGSRSWSQIGEMLLARDDFAVLPLKKASCPQKD